MKTILLSFNPLYYEPLKNGEKKYEYRSRFANEEVKAYLYLSTPVRKVVAIVYFGNKIELEKMRESYGTDDEVKKRIDDYIYIWKKKYAVPITRIDFLEPLSLESIRKEIPGFMPPQSYLNIKESSTLELLLKKMKLTGSSILIDHNTIVSDDICTN